MVENYQFFKNWIKRFPIQFILIPFGIAVSIFKNDIPPEPLLDSISSDAFLGISIFVILVIFSFEIIRAIHVAKKSRSKMSINPRITEMDKNLKAINSASSFSMDAFSVWVIGVTLMVIAFGTGNPEFDKASFFANFHAVFIAPFFSFTVYYGEYLKNQKKLKSWK